MKENSEYCGFSPIWDRFRKSVRPIATTQKSLNRNHYNETPHVHDFPQLWYCAAGKYTHVVGGQTYFCEAGSLIIVPSGIIHHFTISAEDNCELYQTNLLFNVFRDFSEISEIQCAVFSFLPAFAKEIKFTPHMEYTFEGEERQTADAIFKRLAELDSAKTPQISSAYKNLFFSLFALSPFTLSAKIRLRAENFIREKYLPLLRTVYHINVNYGNKISREELVELSGICQTDYFRYIKRIVGMTFSTYLQRIRVRHAIVLSTFSPYSLSYIADICGFGDLSYMDNRIKKYSGEHRRPRDMRRERKKYIKDFPFMIMTRDDYESIPKFFNEL